MENNYYIQNESGDYWNNEIGWTEFKSLADIFKVESPESFNLPMGGYWVKA